MKHMIAVLVFAMTLTVSGRAATTQQTQDPLSKKQVSALIATAKTPAEHERIAAYYRGQASDYLAQSQYHAQMASEFKGNPATNNDKVVRQTVNHCAYLAESLRAQSAKAAELARQHEQMSNDAKK
jgi:hypothetical protein